MSGILPNVFLGIWIILGVMLLREFGIVGSKYIQHLLNK